jgi:LmbE family N-acetylglucosaminyl deacetylase
MSRVLVVVAHRDDETIGAGGTLSKHAEAGDEVLAISMTDGVGSRPELRGEAAKQIRSENSEKAAEILGIDWLSSANFPDNQMDTVPFLEIVQFIENSQRGFLPEKIYTHFVGDLNVDHVLTAQATLTAFRPEPDQFCHQIVGFEVASSTDYGALSGRPLFRPDLFIGIDGQWAKKKAALEAYGSELRPYPHSRSIESLESLNRLRGNQVGLHFAEAFQTYRSVLR